MVSLTRVAREAGVSLTTASLVLNPGKQANRISPACAQRVRETARSLGYVANYHARSMKLGRSETIALAIDVGAAGVGISTLSSSYFSQLAAGVERAARPRGYTLALVSPSGRGGSLDRTLQGLRQKRFDAGVVLGKVIRADQFAQFDAPTALPVVIIEPPVSTPWPVVDWDERAAVHLALQHLAELGHRDILWLGPIGTHSRDQTNDRERLFIQTAWEMGLRGRSCRFRRAAVGEFGLLTDAEQALFAHLDANPARPWTAVLAYNDKTGIAACRALQSRGLRVPDDVSVVGFDDTEAGLCSPPLTTVSQELIELGRRAGELAIRLGEDADAIRRAQDSRDVIAPQLVVRNSTAPAKPGEP